MSGKAICTACLLVFASDTSFDRHRVGSFKADTRRCLTLAELLAGAPIYKDTLTKWRRNRYGHLTHFAALTGQPGLAEASK